MIDEQVLPLTTELQEAALALSPERLASSPEILVELCATLWNRYGAWYEGQHECGRLDILEQVLAEDLGEYLALAGHTALCEPLCDEWLAAERQLTDKTHCVVLAVHERELDRMAAAYPTGLEPSPVHDLRAGGRALDQSPKPARAAGAGHLSRTGRTRRRKLRSDTFEQARKDAAAGFDQPRPQPARADARPLAPVPAVVPLPAVPTPEGEDPEPRGMWARRAQIRARNLDVYKRYKSNREKSDRSPQLVRFAVYNGGTRHAIVVLDPWESSERPTYTGSVYALERAGGPLSKGRRFLRSGSVAREAWAGDLAVMRYEGAFDLDELRTLLKAGKITDKRVVEVAPLPPGDPCRA
ncbi:hypothetical protein ABZ069_36715 [Streptomyces microflavus]|uniref:hypothetical protein n=1 Tax=Streptomyces microflavus TaxID=1919 RepID=UPI0033ABA7E0